MGKKTKTDVDREVTMNDAMKFALIIVCVMASIAIAIKTWPTSGLVTVLFLIAALLYFRRRN